MTNSLGIYRALAVSGQGLSQVCVDAWCNLDVPLAKKWGARLERTGTLAQGAKQCDFRWHLEERKGADR